MRRAIKLNVYSARRDIMWCAHTRDLRSSENSNEEVESSDKSVRKINSLTNPKCLKRVLLQTLIFCPCGEDKRFSVRALIDSGSQKSYMRKEAVSKMNYKPIKDENMIHNLFGEVQSYQKH